jgi:hypothetical protein
MFLLIESKKRRFKQYKNKQYHIIRENAERGRAFWQVFTVGLTVKIGKEHHKCHEEEKISISERMGAGRDAS